MCFCREGCEVTETLIKEILLACPGANIKTELGDKGTTTVARGIQPAHGPARILIDSKVCNLVLRALNIKKNILNSKNKKQGTMITVAQAKKEA